LLSPWKWLWAGPLGLTIEIPQQDEVLLILGLMGQMQNVFGLQLPAVNPRWSRFQGCVDQLLQFLDVVAKCLNGWAWWNNSSGKRTSEGHCGPRIA
jgi:hypothetical protein